MKRMLAVLLALFIIISGMVTVPAEEMKPYGVFLSVTEDLSRFGNYETVVIDAQYYSQEEIEEFRSCGHKVYSYLNIGSLEDFRPYYNDYSDLSLGAYEHWDEEVWVDVSERRWQDFILATLVPDLQEKQVDGFFVDNCDVFYIISASPAATAEEKNMRDEKAEQILTGLGTIMSGLVATGHGVLINGGDTFLDAWCDRGGSWNEVITGINQETVFSSILWDEETGDGLDAFGTAEPEDHEYFTSYIERYGEQGADIYLLEYTRDAELIKQIDEYCGEHGFTYYISDSIELDG